MLPPAALLLGALVAAPRQGTTVSTVLPDEPATEILTELLSELLVQVVDPAGQALPGAEIRSLLEGARLASGRILAHAPSLAEMDGWLAEGALLSADGLGQVRVPLAPGRALLIAGRRGALWGHAWVESEEGEPDSTPAALRLELRPDFDLRVRVEDASGQPCAESGVSLRLGPRHLPGLHGPGGWRFAHVGYQAWGSDLPLGVTLAGSLHVPAPRLLVDPRQPPREPLVLRRPAGGALEVLLLDEDGAPLRTPALVFARHARDPRPEAERRFDQDLGRAGQATTEGRVRFADVPLGAELLVLVETRERHAEARVTGPLGAGETVTLALCPAPLTGAWAEAAAPPRVPDELPDGVLVGRLLVDPGLPLEQIELRLTSARAFFEGQPWSTTAVRDGERFRVEEFPAGPALLAALVAGERVLEIPVQASPGPEAELAPAVLDLRGALHLHRLRLTGLDPARPFHARILHDRARLPSERLRTLHVREPALEILSPWPALDLEVFAPGYRRVVLRDLRAEATVALAPGLPVRLRLALEGELPPPPRHLKAALVPADGPLRGIDWEGPAFGPTREILLHAWEPGRQRVLWILGEGVEEQPGLRGSAAGLELPPMEIEVREVAGEQTFELALDADALARALAEHAPEPR